MPMKSLAAGLMLLAMPAAWAVDCANAVTTPDMNECAAQEQKALEARLNKTYQAVLQALKSEGGAATQKQLVAAQRLWVKFREADCKAVYEHHAGGTIRTVMYSGCMRSRAEQRIRELEQFQPR